MELFFNKNYRDKLNSDSKILYGFLLNRLTLSAKNNWIDENGNVFLIFTRKEVQERLDLSDKTVTKAFKQLKDCKLIHEKRQGANKPNLIYVGKIDHDEDLIKLIRKNYESRIVKSTTQDTENLRPNYNNNNYNNIRFLTKLEKVVSDLYKFFIVYVTINTNEIKRKKCKGGFIIW